jgi:hypothetical protein
MRLPLGQACSPPVNSTGYNKASAVIGAFATDLQLSLDTKRLFSPIRGNGTVTWADVLPDAVDSVPPGEPWYPPNFVPNWPSGSANTPNPFQFDCGQAGTQRCDGNHETGAVVTEADTRAVTLPGEPFAMAQTEDGTALAVTHQTSQLTSVLLTGLPACIEQGSTCVAPSAGLSPVDPSMQFVLTGVPIGGDGLAPVPHDPDSSIPPCELPNVNYQTPCVRPAFLETTHSAAEIDLLRYYNDDGSSLLRPFLVREAAYPLTVNFGGTDSRGIVIDDTPRRACKASNPGADLTTCAQLPARVFLRQPHAAFARHRRNRRVQRRRQLQPRSAEGKQQRSASGRPIQSVSGSHRRRVGSLCAPCLRRVLRLERDLRLRPRGRGHRKHHQHRPGPICHGVRPLFTRRRRATSPRSG